MPPTKEQKERLKEWPELADNIDHERRYLVDGIKRIDEATVDIGEAYSREHIACHLHVSLKGRGTHFGTRNLCIGFQGFKNVGEARVNNLPSNLREDAPEDSGSCRVRQEGCDYLVLVAVGYVPKSGEGMRSGDVWQAGRVPSLVRLAPLDDCPMSRAHRMQGAGFLELCGGRVGGRRGVLDGKLNDFGVGRPPSFGAKPAKLPYQVVQRPSKVMGNISDDDAPSDMPVLGKGCCPKDMPAAFAVELNVKSYSVAFRSLGSIHLVLEDIAVLFGPPNLAPTTAEVGLVGHD